MPPKCSASAGAILLVMCLVAPAHEANAQGVEVMPFSGYRFGGDFFELATGHPVDTDGAPSVGVVVNVPLDNGMQVEAMVTQQRASVPIALTPFNRAATQRVTVANAQVGGLQELLDGRVRPFLTGMVGLTRYASEIDSEVRFSVGAGGGVKLFPARRVGLRLDGRLFTTFVDADLRFLACSPGTCITALHVNMVWQAEFTAGIVFRLQ